MKSLDSEQDAALIASMRDIGFPVPAHIRGQFSKPDLMFALRLAGLARKEGTAMVRRESGREVWALVGAVSTALRNVIFTSTDDQLRDLMQLAPGRPALVVECQLGCAHCCYENVQVTIPEAILAAQALADPDDPRRTAVFKDVEVAAGLGIEDRFAMVRPCPFLVDNACSIYADRPVPCRTLLSPDAKRCEIGLQNALAGLGFGGVLSHTLPTLLGCAFHTALRGICKDLGLQYDIVVLVPAVAAILRDPGIAERWASGEKVFATQWAAASRT
jgi:hypothetical protein